MQLHVTALTSVILIISISLPFSNAYGDEGGTLQKVWNYFLKKKQPVISSTPTVKPPTSVIEEPTLCNPPVKNIEGCPEDEVRDLVKSTSNPECFYSGAIEHADFTMAFFSQSNGCECKARGPVYGFSPRMRMVLRNSLKSLPKPYVEIKQTILKGDRLDREAVKQLRQIANKVGIFKCSLTLEPIAAAGWLKVGDGYEPKDVGDPRNNNQPQRENPEASRATPIR